MKTTLGLMCLMGSLAAAYSQEAGYDYGSGGYSVPATVFENPVVYAAMVVYTAPVVYYAPVYYAAAESAGYGCEDSAGYGCYSSYSSESACSTVTVIGGRCGAYSYANCCQPESTVVAIGDRPGSWY